MTTSPPGPTAGGARGAGRKRPLPGMVAAAEQDYHTGRNEGDKFLAFVRDLLEEGWTDFEALSEVYWTLRAQQAINSDDDQRDRPRTPGQDPRAAVEPVGVSPLTGPAAAPNSAAPTVAGACQPGDQRGLHRPHR